MSTAPAAPRRHVFYLHGFASSAHSSKARFLAGCLGAHGVPLHCPDFNAPDFFGLTITRMLTQLADAVAALPPAPVALVGSSLGGFVAVMAAERGAGARPSGVSEGWPPDRPIDRLVLLAPALDFSLKNDRLLGPRLEEWRRTNRLEIFHYGEGRMREVGYGLYEDAQRYDPFLVEPEAPVLIYQGTRDEAVDPALVRRWADRRRHVDLRLLDDDHQLLGSLDEIWRGVADMLELPA